MKKLDLYIVRKFLGTFIYAIALIVVIAVVFDVSEKLDDFFDAKVSFSQIAFDYYLNFIPYFINLFSPLFIFISVIFFTAQMASRTEIIAILNAGVSFRRFMMPYIFCSALLALFSFFLGSYIIPKANERRLAFENKFIRNPYEFRSHNIHRQLAPGEFIYFESYSNREKMGYLFTLEKIKEKKIVYKLSADRAVWDSVGNKWLLENYFERSIGSHAEKFRQGLRLDTVLAFTHAEFDTRDNVIETMSPRELDKYIEEQKLKGTGKIVFAEIKKNERISYPFAAFVLTIIGVSIANRKIRGGIGLQLVAGILLSFSYIMFMQISTTFAIKSNLPAALAVWIPNMIYVVIALWIVRFAQK